MGFSGQSTEACTGNRLVQVWTDPLVYGAIHPFPLRIQIRPLRGSCHCESHSAGEKKDKETGGPSTGWVTHAGADCDMQRYLPRRAARCPPTGSALMASMLCSRASGSGQVAGWPP